MALYLDLSTLQESVVKNSKIKNVIASQEILSHKIVEISINVELLKQRHKKVIAPVITTDDSYVIANKDHKLI
mgnify:CR=1 FL=1